MVQKVNFQKDLDNLIASLDGIYKDHKPTLLLHACCGPCSSHCLEYLTRYFQITVYYYNPNIYPPQEYFRRLNELKNLYTRFPPALEGKVQLVEAEYEPSQFYSAIGIIQNPELADEPEKGERCRRCYELRLKRAYEYASEHKFDYFCTTLSISPFKDALKINKIGSELAEKGNDCNKEMQKTSGINIEQTAAVTKDSDFLTKWLPSDFKKNSGFLRSLEISKEYGLYRQEYCGCIYSKQNKEKMAVPKTKS